MIGRTLNGVYRLSELVGGGGFADVYLGRDLRTNTIVAVKVLHPHFARDQAILRKFDDEARTAQALVEPHVVRVLDAGQDEGTYFIVMEYVQGHTLAHLVQTRGGLPVDEAVGYVCQVLQALEAAHQARIVHRDIKPLNVMVMPDGVAKVMDFGIAKQEAAGTMTRTGMYLGTPEYMSPEQAKGIPVDARSDLYSTAITLFELLAGQPPFRAASPWEVLSQQVNAEPPPLSRFRQDVPPALEQAVARGLAKAPEQRFQSAAEMRLALEQAISREVAGVPADTGQSPGVSIHSQRRPSGEGPAPAGENRWGRPVPVPFLAVGLVTVVLAAGLGLSRIGDLAPAPTPGPTIAATATRPSSSLASLPTATVAAPTPAPPPPTPTAALAQATAPPATATRVPPTTTPARPSPSPTAAPARATPVAPTATLVVAPTATLVPPTPAPARAAAAEAQPTAPAVPRTPTAAPPTPTPAPVYPAPVLADARADSGSVLLSWSYGGALAADEWFDVIAWPVGSEPRGGIANVKETSYRFGGGRPAGDYNWTIAVIRKQDDRVTELVRAGETKRFSWSPPGGGGGGSPPPCPPDRRNC
ncbi:MAG: protein kinase [Chloroflexi bacterium]|nr:protein kinase [Chloroflexota bacterium]